MNRRNVRLAIVALCVVAFWVAYRFTKSPPPITPAPSAPSVGWPPAADPKPSAEYTKRLEELHAKHPGGYREVKPGEVTTPTDSTEKQNAPASAEAPPEP